VLLRELVVRQSLLDPVLDEFHCLCEPQHAR
jgi:hypothetical protein